MSEHGHGAPEFVPHRDYPRGIGGNIASLFSAFISLFILAWLVVFATQRDTPPVAFAFLGFTILAILGKLAVGLRK